MQHIQPDALFPSERFGFTQVVASPPGRMVFVSGQVAWDRECQMVGGDDVVAGERLPHDVAARGEVLCAGVAWLRTRPV